MQNVKTEVKALPTGPSGRAIRLQGLNECSNPVGGIEVCCECCVSRARHSSRSPTVCVRVCVYVCARACVRVCHLARSGEK